MGTVSRHRLAEKRRRREQASTFGSEEPSAAPSARDAIYLAIGALRRPDPDLYRRLLDSLAGDSVGAAAALRSLLHDAVDRVVQRNWDAPGVVRQAERRLGPAHAEYARAVLGERPASGEDLARGIEVLAFLLSLPSLPRLGVGRRPARPGHDLRVLERVRALLAKAESTTFAEEAEALSSKAQELMARHSIDEAMVDAVTGPSGAPGDAKAPGGVRVPVDEPYASPKSILLSVVATANRCKAVWSKELGFSTVLGYESDLEFVEILYTSLLVQATGAMVAAGPQFDRNGRSRTRSFRQSFLLAYSVRIGDRLEKAERATVAAAAEEYGDALLPVLAGRLAAVDAACDEAFPDLRRRAISMSNAAGWMAGSVAADMASLTARTEMPGPTAS